MSISASARDRKRVAITGANESGAATTPITLSERSMTGLALIRIFVSYLFFQQLFWKMPPSFRGLYPYIIRVWTAELLVSISLLFGLFTRLGAILATILSLQLYVGLAYAPGEWIWTYGMLVLLALVLVAVPAGRRLGADQWLAPRLQAAGQHRLARIASWLV